MIGHGNSTYYRKSERERMEIFRKIEPSLTFMDTSIMEAKHRDVSSPLEASNDRIANLEETVAMLVEADKERRDLEKHEKELEKNEKES